MPVSTKPKWPSSPADALFLEAAFRKMRLVALIWMLALGRVDAAPHDGIYSDVCVDHETGDQEGIELQLHVTNGAPTVILKTCEGGCDEEPSRQISLRGDRITFLADDKYVDAAGHPVETDVHRFTGRFEKGALTLRRVGLRKPERLTLWTTAGLRARRSRRPELSSSDWPTPVETCR
jgi:hypothetical protein